MICRGMYPRFWFMENVHVHFRWYQICDFVHYTTTQAAFAVRLVDTSCLLLPSCSCGEWQREDVQPPQIGSMPILALSLVHPKRNRILSCTFCLCASSFMRKFDQIHICLMWLVTRKSTSVYAIQAFHSSRHKGQLLRRDLVHGSLPVTLLLRHWTVATISLPSYMPFQLFVAE